MLWKTASSVASEAKLERAWAMVINGTTPVCSEGVYRDTRFGVFIGAST